MKRRLLTSLLGIIVIALAGLITNLSLSKKPLLGLDLQGGASVTLRPAYGNPDPTAFGEVVKLYRARINSLNIGEAEVIRQGNTIVVNLPGVKDQDRALQLIGTTGKVTFRPVLARQGGFSGLTVPLVGASGASGPLVTVPAGATGTADHLDHGVHVSADGGCCRPDHNSRRCHGGEWGRHADNCRGSHDHGSPVQPIGAPHVRRSGPSGPRRRAPGPRRLGDLLAGQGVRAG